MSKKLDYFEYGAFFKDISACGLDNVPIREMDMDDINTLVIKMGIYTKKRCFTCENFLPNPTGFGGRCRIGKQEIEDRNMRCSVNMDTVPF